MKRQHVMSQVLRNHFLGAKKYGPPMEREHFHCCMSVEALVNANTIAGGKKESTTKDLKVQQVDCRLCLASYCQ